jgi:amphiphysin
MLQDSVIFKDSVSSESLAPQLALGSGSRTPALLQSGSSFGGSLAVIFSPMGSEYNLAAKFPQSEVTLNSISQYQVLMEEMRGELPRPLALFRMRI